MDIIGAISLIAAIASLILAIVAIWLSIVFYRMSSEISENTKEAAKGIGASVERLEKLFDKLYSDTFSMMRDTVSDMRKHMWPENDKTEEKITKEAEKRADNKFKIFESEIKEELSDLLKRQKIADENMSSMQSELAQMMERVITTSRKLETEAREETIQGHIMKTILMLRKRGLRVNASHIVDRLSDVFPASRIIEELAGMERDGIITTDDPFINPQTRITLGPKYKK